MPTELPDRAARRGDTSSLPGAGIVASVVFAALVMIVVVALLLPR